jgi:D-sedoheptulose 7-phosphate isomerase
MERQLDEHLHAAASIREQLPLLERIARQLIHCFSQSGRVYLCGNGGSAADAQHIAAELVGRYRMDRPPLPAVALTTDTSILTAISNDLGAESCFSRQVEALMTPQDTLWVLSTSGNSPNVLLAAQAARKLGAAVIGFTGRSGGYLPPLCDFCFLANHDRTDRIQEVHQLAYHLVCERIESSVVDRNGG